MKRKQTICFGKQPVLTALEEGRSLERIYVRKEYSGKVIDMVLAAAEAAHVPVNRVPREKLNRLTNLNHQGIVAVLSEIDYYKVEDIIDQCYNEGRDPLILILDGITDVGNFGAICRSALGMGADAVVIGTHNAATINAQAIKASAGAIHQLPVCRHEDLAATVQVLRSSGISIIALDSNGNTVAREIEKDVPYGIIIGSEGEGISDNLTKLADIICKLPINSKLESYNASVAAALILYEVRR